MARSDIQRRQEAERHRIEAYEATLRRVSSAVRPAPDFERAIREAGQGFEGQAIRDAYSWRPKLKTRDAAKLRLVAARHLFARYPVPASLERIWLDAEGLARDEVRLRKDWYITAARGASLYKAGADRWLSRKEVHWFLNPPGEIGFDEALWQAIARSFTDDIGVAMRIARSKIARTSRADLPFWREAARFFCANPTTVEEIDDLFDFLADSRAREGYSLKGRTLGSLRRQMQDWHRDLEAIQRIEAARRRAEAARAGHAPQASVGGRWAGSVLQDWSWKPNGREARGAREEYLVVQLTTALELVAESRAMHHCVSTYAAKCITGYASIWSLRRRRPGGVDLMLTIELDRQHRAMQVRGFANRLARPDEQTILTRWAKARGVSLP